MSEFATGDRVRFVRAESNLTGKDGTVAAVGGGRVVVAFGFLLTRRDVDRIPGRGLVSCRPEELVLL